MNAQITIERTTFPARTFVLTCLIASLWVNASEVFRYFVFVMPMTREALHMVPNVAPMNWEVFLNWGIWDSILVMKNMRLADVNLLAIALPLAWFECVITSVIVQRYFGRRST